MNLNLNVPALTIGQPLRNRFGHVEGASNTVPWLG